MTYERIKELLRKGEKLSIVYKRYLNKAENDEFFLAGWYQVVRKEVKPCNR